MPNTDVQGIVIPLVVSPDNGTTNYTMTCIFDHSYDSKFSVQNEQSQCGIHTGIGAHEFSHKFNAAVNITPDAVSAGVGQASYKIVSGWHLNKTLLLVTVQHGSSGADFFVGGQYYLNELSHTLKVGEVMKFSGTLTGTGVPDITP